MALQGWTPKAQYMTYSISPPQVSKQSISKRVPSKGSSLTRTEIDILGHSGFSCPARWDESIYTACLGQTMRRKGIRRKSSNKFPWKEIGSRFGFPAQPGPVLVLMWAFFSGLPPGKFYSTSPKCAAVKRSVFISIRYIQIWKYDSGFTSIRFVPKLERLPKATRE